MAANASPVEECCGTAAKIAWIRSTTRSARSRCPHASSAEPALPSARLYAAIASGEGLTSVISASIASNEARSFRCVALTILAEAARAHGVLPGGERRMISSKYGSASVIVPGRYT